MKRLIGSLFVLLLASTASAQGLECDINGCWLAGTERPVGPPSKTMTGLEMGVVALQAFDGAWTWEAVHHGARELNPIASATLAHPVAWGALKVGTAAFTIAAARSLWHAGRKKAAIGVLLGSNAVMGYVAVHNRLVWCREGRC